MVLLSLVVGETMDIDLYAHTGRQCIVEMWVVETQWEGQDAYLASLRDITERRREERELIRKTEELARSREEQLVTKDRFMSHVSHELRTPLAAVYEFNALLLDRVAGPTTAKQNKLLGRSIQNIEQLIRMINDLLNVTRAQTGKLTIQPERISPVEPIEETVAIYETVAAANNIKLTAEIARNLPDVYADPGRVRQVLVNLINNAIKYTPKEGKVSVSAYVHHEDPSYVRIDVRDTGRGIAAEHCHKIFDYLYQTEKSVDSGRHGLGLGLYICQELVSLHGGSIWVESRLQQGSTFSFTLPFYSLSKLLLPILHGINASRDALALFSLGWSQSLPVPNETEEPVMMRQAIDVLQCSIESAKFVVIPNRTGKEGRGQLFVVGCVQQFDVEQMTQRIQNTMQDRMREQMRVADEEVKLDVLIHLIPDPLSEAEANETLARDLAVRIERLVHQYHRND